jgi:formylglycine-generating enzyme required for sulfatase activity
MAGKIFINYRRDDSAGHAGRVHDRLEREFGANLLFMDVDAIPLGENFIKVLRDEVAKCDVLLALIGPNWLNVRDEDGNRRLDNPMDFLRIEIATALQRDIPVIPILLDGAKMPKADQLPQDLEELSVRNGIDIRHVSFHSDMDKVIRGLKGARASQDDRMRAEGRVLVDAAIVRNANGKWFLPGAGRTEWFKDHEAAPEMVVVPAGSFKMGSSNDEPERESYQAGTESPQHEVTIAQPFAVGRHAITRGQFAAFVTVTGHEISEGARIWKDGLWVDDPMGSWRAPGFFQDDSHPVVCVSSDDAKAYAAWLGQITGKFYRLLSEAEREYATRAGTLTPFWWGSSITPAQANYNGGFVYEGGGSKGVWRKSTMPVDSFQANPWGLYNVHGNLWEWCEDVWHDNYSGAPVDGSAWLRGGDPTRRVVRGGSWAYYPQNLRAAARIWVSSVVRVIYIGFRLARTLNP